MVSQSIDVVLDVTDLRCPMPLLKTKQALSSMEPGQIIQVISTDAGSLRDIPAFIDLTSHSLLEREQIQEKFIFLIKKGE